MSASPTSPTRSVTLSNLFNKYNVQDAGKFGEIRRTLIQTKRVSQFTKQIQEGPTLGEQFISYINHQMSKKNKAMAVKKAQSTIKLKTVTREGETDGITNELFNLASRNIRVQKAVKKIKSKLKNQHLTKDQKFENKFTAFTDLTTFVDVRPFLQSINNGEELPKNQQPLPLINLHSEEIEEDFENESEIESEEEDDKTLGAYKKIIKRSKQIMSEQKQSMDKVRRKMVDQSNKELQGFLELEQSQDYSANNEDERAFYQYIDKILEAEIKQQSITTGKQMELEQIQKEKYDIMMQFKSEIENERQADLKKLNINEPEKQQKVFMEKSKKILQLLEKTTNLLFKKISMPKLLPEQTQAVRMKRRQQIQSVKQISVLPELINMPSIEEKPLKKLARLRKQIKQSTQNEILLFQDKIEDNDLFKKGVTLSNVMDIKQFVYDNSQTLKGLSLPKLKKGISQLYDTNQYDINRKGILPKQIECSSPSPLSRSQPKLSLKSRTESNSNVYHFSRYTTSPEVVKQRNQLVKLIKKVDSTQLAMKLELPIYKCEMSKFEDELNRNKFKPQVLESLSYFSKTDRSDVRLNNKKAKPRGIHIL